MWTVQWKRKATNRPVQQHVFFAPVKITQQQTGLFAAFFWLRYKGCFFQFVCCICGQLDRPRLNSNHLLGAAQQLDLILHSVQIFCWASFSLGSWTAAFSGYFCSWIYFFLIFSMLGWFRTGFFFSTAMVNASVFQKPSASNFSAGWTIIRSGYIHSEI